MCGIAGLFSTFPVSRIALDAMTDIQTHRGPDGRGTWISKNQQCALGHRRLAILDLSSDAQQPMRDSVHDVVITFNGEIYNYVELRDQLIALGHSFQSKSDTEVLLKAYIAWGTECLSRLNGMFAFAIWDQKKQKLFCARDRFGEKPFLYSLTRTTFAFASEAKALAILRDVELSVSPRALCTYLESGPNSFDSSEETFLRGIKQILPAYAIEVSLDSSNHPEISRSWCYWTIDKPRHEFGQDDLNRSSEQLLHLLTESVRIRLRSDVAVGSCLSGGLDSSAIVSLIRQIEPNTELHTFTGRFPGHPLDEGEYATLVSNANTTIAHEVIPTATRFRDEARRFFWHADFPVGSLSQFAQWCVFGLAKQHNVTVLLDGQGSDELLAGYGNSIYLVYLRELAAQGHWLSALKEQRYLSESQKAFRFSRLFLQSEMGAKYLGRLRAHIRTNVISKNFFSLGNHKPFTIISPFETISSQALSDILWKLSFRTMLSSLLRFGDRLSMAHSREVRLPFCDHRIAELVFLLSPDLLLKNGEVKQVLRHAIRNLVPPKIATRPKQGFIPPQERWLSGDLFPWVKEVLLDHQGPISNFVNRNQLETWLHHFSVEKDSTTLWNLVNLFLWSEFALTSFLNQNRVSASTHRHLQLI